MQLLNSTWTWVSLKGHNLFSPHIKRSLKCDKYHQIKMFHQTIFIKSSPMNIVLTVSVPLHAQGYTRNKTIRVMLIFRCLLMNNLVTACRQDFSVETPWNAPLLKKICRGLANNTEMVPNEIRCEVTNCDELANSRARTALVLAVVLLL
jgi:hypothetical protein